jgi:hypothetical protein
VKIDLEAHNKPHKSNFKTLAQLNQERDSFKRNRMQSFNKPNKIKLDSQVEPKDFAMSSKFSKKEVDDAVLSGQGFSG